MTPPVCRPQHARSPGSDDGATMVEVLVATALASVVFAMVLGFVWTQLSAARAQPDAADVQQRARAVAEILTADVTAAGAWGDTGGPRPGPACCLPILWPRRLGTSLADPPTVARPDVLTVLRGTAGSTPGRLREPLPGPLSLHLADGCVVTRPVCGMAEGDHAVVFDPRGRHDFFVVGPVGSDSASLLLRQAWPASAFEPGTVAASVETATYYFDPARRQLRVYDGYRSDVPVIDDVVAVRFEYWGTQGVSARNRAEAGTETCWFDADGHPKFGRATSPPGATIVRILSGELHDGPWCGEGGNRFDADLLRVRLVRAVIRLAAVPEAARGTGPDFVSPGRALNSHRLVPDMEVIINAAPRALDGDY